MVAFSSIFFLFHGKSRKKFHLLIFIVSIQSQRSQNFPFFFVSFGVQCLSSDTRKNFFNFISMLKLLELATITSFASFEGKRREKNKNKSRTLLWPMQQWFDALLVHVVQLWNRSDGVVAAALRMRMTTTIVRFAHYTLLNTFNCFQSRGIHPASNPFRHFCETVRRSLRQRKQIEK